MRRLMILAACAALTGCASTYRRPIPGLLGGYSDHQVSEGVWDVKFRSNGRTPRSYALYAAMYRSAELAASADFPYFQIVKADLVMHTVSVSVNYVSGGPPIYVGESVTLSVHGARTPNAELKCESEDEKHCMTLTTEEVLRDLEPVVKRRRGANAPPAQSQ